MFKTLVSFFIIISFFSGCGTQPSPGNEQNRTAPDPLFTSLTADSTGIGFTNLLTEGLNTNVLMYEYFYNGGGVAIGDVDGNGLDDIYFSGNMTENKLYLNKGMMHFQDITGVAGVAGRPGPWKTGVTMADINGDGKTDLFLCYSGKLPGSKRLKQLFINEGNDSNGLPHFSERAEQFGLTDSSFSTQAFFFDMDHDGDLDLFLLNHSPLSLPVLDEPTTAAVLKKQDPLSGCRLYQNDKNFFRDVTFKSGISSSSLSYGLGAAMADLNGDGWTDIYVSNDYTVPDYLYINNKDGTFTDQIRAHLGHTTQFSMGNDVSDINNDGLADIFTLDMLPEDNRRQKLLMAPDNYEKFDLTLRTGWYYQYMRNMLHINNGNGNFSEVGQFSGICNTDWSWAPLFADYDNDGWKDLFVTNGVLRDFTNMDFIKFTGDFLKNNKGDVRRQNLLDLVHQMPSSEVQNYMFKNNKDLTFSNMGQAWGFQAASNSNGAAYADLDNDGDLDLVVNNINQPAFVYRNEAGSRLNNHYLKIKLEGSGQNTNGLGATVQLFCKDRQQYLEQMPTRGFQSSISPVMHFGLGTDQRIDSMKVSWPSGKAQVLIDVAADQLLLVREKDATGWRHDLPLINPLFKELPSPVVYHQQPYAVNDFKRQPLLINPMSFAGPCLAKSDVNGDGLQDVFVGGGNGQAAVIYLQKKRRTICREPSASFGSRQNERGCRRCFFRR